MLPTISTMLSILQLGSAITKIESQVKLSHPHAAQFLKRICTLVSYFKRSGEQSEKLKGVELEIFTTFDGTVPRICFSVYGKLSLRFKNISRTTILIRLCN